jgi:hypothetical protein
MIDSRRKETESSKILVNGEGKIKATLKVKRLKKVHHLQTFCSEKTTNACNQNNVVVKIMFI